MGSDGGPITEQMLWEANRVARGDFLKMADHLNEQLRIQEEAEDEPEREECGCGSACSMASCGNCGRCCRGH